MKKIWGLFFAFVICILLGLVLPWMRQNRVSLTADEYHSILGGVE